VLADLRSHRTEILRIARARGASHLRVFGSVARGDAADSSDVDFLVDLDPDRGLFDLGGLLMDLRDLLGHDGRTLPRRRQYLAPRHARFSTRHRVAALQASVAGACQ